MSRILLKQNIIGTLDSFPPDLEHYFGSQYSLSASLHEAQGLMVRSSTVDLSVYPNLIAIARAGAGVNNIPVAEATKKGICVFNTPGANAESVCDLVFLALGLIMRNSFNAIQFTTQLLLDGTGETKAEKEKKNFVGCLPRGRTIGVIGDLGQIGRRVVATALEKGMHVVCYDIAGTGHTPSHEDCVRVTSLLELVVLCDVITVHSSGTNEVLTSELLQKVKPGCIILNFARSGVYDDQAVADCVENGRISAYGTDFCTIQALALQQKFPGRVICFPHLGASTIESENNCTQMAVTQMRDYFETGSVVNSVNFPSITLPPIQRLHSRMILHCTTQSELFAKVQKSGKLDGYPVLQLVANTSMAILVIDGLEDWLGTAFLAYRSPAYIFAERLLHGR